MLAPSLLLWPWPPRTSMPPSRVPLTLLWLERIGQFLCVTVAALVSPGPLIAGWAAPLFLAAAAYYALWARYLFGGRTTALLFERWWIVPIPLAVFPVAVFLSAAAWLSNPWLAVSAIVLAAGHLPASALRARADRMRG
jgi:hypothetical protein